MVKFFGKPSHPPVQAPAGPAGPSFRPVPGPAILAPVSCAIVLGSAISLSTPTAANDIPPAGESSGNRHETRFNVTYGGLSVGTMTFAVRLDGSGYELTGNGRTRGLAEWFAPGKANLRSTGSLSGSELVADEHFLSVTEDKKTAVLRIAYHPSGEPEVFLEPDKRKKNKSPEKYVSFRPDDLRNVVDPASTLVVPVDRDQAGNPEAVCGRNLRVYDGETRFDIRLSYKENRAVRTGGYDGWAYVCRLEYVPVAGHRKKHRSVERMAANRDMEIWLAPVAANETGNAVFTAIRIHVPTWIGTFNAEPEYFGSAAGG